MKEIVASIAIASMCAAAPAYGSPYADAVKTYNPGTIRSDYQVGTASLGKTAAFTPVVITPFNAPFSPGELTGIGPGGNLILHLGQTAATGSGYTLGVHAGVNLLNTGGSSGKAGNPASTFSVRRADVSVSFDNITWVPLQSNVVFGVPTNWYSAGVTAPSTQTTPGTVEADFTKPFTGHLSDFNGLTYAQMLSLLDGSAGGTWLNLTEVALPGVNYVQFSVGEDDVQMYLDMVVAIPEPATAGMAMIGMVVLATRCRRN